MGTKKAFIFKHHSPLFSFPPNQSVWISPYRIEVNTDFRYLAPSLSPSVSVLRVNYNAGGTMGGTARWHECL